MGLDNWGHQRRLVRLASVATLLGLMGCGIGDSKQEALGPKAGMPEISPPDFDRKDFSDRSTRIDNKWLPLIPGTQFTQQGEANRGEGITPHRIVITVTDVTKVINGVRTLVVWERDFNGDQLVEAEIAFFAQDDKGNVWLMGEYPEEYELGKFDGAPSSWIAGLGGAHAGIIMPAEPRKGAPTYLQGLAPDTDFQDLAKVHAVNQETCVPTGCYQNVIVFDEWDPAAQPQDGHQLKHHAPGVGPVRVEAVGGVELETLVLGDVVKLDPAGMAEARRGVLELDGRAYKVNARYEATPPAEPMR
ncbi:MAG: hypothetical protein M3357_15310 [Actinomycetota bacterium]|nr:hypothetical protein [Actinomycetota bacterium]